ncbi:MAG: BCCT family transporter [Porticoccaceae bacterium]|nr:BCCT family transporter [Porticoccaceae bacterium]
MANKKPATTLNLTTEKPALMTLLAPVMIIAFLSFSLLKPDYAGELFNRMRDFITGQLSWYYISLMNFYLIFVLSLALSKYGKVRLGRDHERPEFSNFSWLSMLFGAGIGIGILFWSIAEPLTHFQNNPFMGEAAALSPEAAQIAMRLTIFHWGLHGWALYASVALILAYFAYRKDLPLTISASLYPILGDRIYGPIGKAADLLAVLGTVFGVATSLGLGAQQMNAGLSTLIGIEVNTSTQIILIIGISVIATLSALTGVNRGIRILSELNMQLTGVILALFLIFGPTLYLLSSFAGNIVDYIVNLPRLGTWVNTDSSDQWQGWWTIFYWGWWIAWSPFCGIFIARISRGRTIREFVFGVLLTPSLLTIFWITVFGNTAFHIELSGDGGIVDAVNTETTSALFTTINLMAMGKLMALITASICTLMLITYFVTSADSATLVICTLVTGGNQNPSALTRIFWGSSIGAVAAVLLFSGGLSALQTASIVTALPFSVILLLATYGLCKSLYQEQMDSDTVPAATGEAH